MKNQASPARLEWLGLLARAERDYLEKAWSELGQAHTPQILSGPETGLIQLTVPAGSGQVCFQFGEASCTRCAVQMGETRGYAVQLGSDLRKAELAACLDAFLQLAGQTQRATLLDPIRYQMAQAKAAREQLAAASSVRFYTTKTS